MTENTGFGLPKKKLFYEDNIGKYFAFYISGVGNNFCGRIEGVSETKVVLKPYVSSRVVDGKRVSQLIDRVARIELSSIVAEEETTEEDIKAQIEYHNCHSKKNDKE